MYFQSIMELAVELSVPSFLQPGRTLSLFQFPTAFSCLSGDSGLAGTEHAASLRTFQVQSLGFAHIPVYSATVQQWRRRRVCTLLCSFACRACLTDKNVVMAAAIACPEIPNSATVSLDKYWHLLWT